MAHYRYHCDVRILCTTRYRRKERCPSHKDMSADRGTEMRLCTQATICGAYDCNPSLKQVWLGRPKFCTSLAAASADA